MKRWGLPAIRSDRTAVLHFSSGDGKMMSDPSRPGRLSGLDKLGGTPESLEIFKICFPNRPQMGCINWTDSQELRDC